jgi:beta-glucosidase
VAAFTRGVQDHGALACAKHFPGHGDTALDSHSTLASVPADRARLEAVELPPFRAAIAADVATIMTAHLALPALGVHGPATTSHAVMTGLLRQELGFQGLIVTDALVMGGIASPLEAAVDAIAAGCDMLLMPPDPVATYHALGRAVAEGRLSEARVLEAAGRVAAARARVKPGKRPSGSPTELARKVAHQAVTLAKGQPPRLPAGTPVITIDDGAEPERLAAWRAAMARHGFVEASRDDVEAPLVAVFAPIRVSKDRSLLPRELVDRLRALAARTPVVLASFSSPFLVAQVPEAAAWLLAYGSGDEAQEAVLAALANGGPYPGKCPVALPEALAGVDGVVRSYGGPSFA